jgi:CDGSH-type Zn-finger protein
VTMRLPSESEEPASAEVVQVLRHAARLARGAGRAEIEVADLANALAELLPAPAARAPVARVTPYRDGPLLLRGAFELTDQDGNAIPTRRTTVALCRCGRSQLRPFCDGTHKLTGFQADSAAERPPARACD